MFENPDAVILNRLGKLQNSVDETANVVSATSKESTSQEILDTVKNSGGGGLLPVYVTGSPTHEREECCLSGCTPYIFTYGNVVIYTNELHILGGTGNPYGHWKWDGEKWLQVSVLPYNLTDGTAVVYNNEIHILGGTNNLYGHYKWNGLTWIQDIFLSIPFQKGSSVVYQNEIHLFPNSGSHTAFGSGGWRTVSNQSFGDYNRTVVFDNEIHAFYKSSTSHYKWDGSSWTQLNYTGSYVRGDVVVFDNTIHLFCGSNNNACYHSQWNKSSDTWTNKANFVDRFFNNGGRAIIFNNELHLLGGNQSYNHFIWNKTNDTYNGVKSLSKNFSDGIAISHNNEIHLFGADDDKYGHYKIVNDNLIYVSKMPSTVGRHGTFDVVSYNGHIHIFNSSSHYKFVDNQWVQLSSLKCAMDDGRVYILNNQLYAYADSSYLIYVWDEETDTWTSTGNTVNKQVGYNATVVLNDTIYIFYNERTDSSNPYYCYLQTTSSIGTGFNNSLRVCETGVEDGGVDASGAIAYTNNGMIYLLDATGRRYQLQGDKLVYVDAIALKPQYSSVVNDNNGTAILCGTYAKANIIRLKKVKKTYRAYNYTLTKGTQIIGTSSMIPLSSNLKVVNETTLQVTETGEVALLVGDTDNDRRLLIKG